MKCTEFVYVGGLARATFRAHAGDLSTKVDFKLSQEETDEMIGICERAAERHRVDVVQEVKTLGTPTIAAKPEGKRAASK